MVSHTAVNKKKRILVWGLTNNRAGTESVIKNYVKLAPEVIFDFLCYEQPLNHKELFCGTKNQYYIIPAKSKRPLVYYIKLLLFVKKHANRYDALWMNINDAANIDALVWAKRFKITKRIIHIHSSSVANSFLIKFFNFFNKNRCLHLGTDYWACSKIAGDHFFKNKTYRIIPNPVNLNNCAFSEIGRMKIRKSYEINDEDLVLGAVGRLSAEKNVGFLIRLLPRLKEKNPNVRLMLVGDGEQRAVLEKMAKEKGVSDYVIFVGAQDDVSKYYSACDVYLMPSLFEGLGIALLEAQFNGLPCVVSSEIPSEAIISSNVQKVSLGDTDEWIEAILGTKGRENKLNLERASKYTPEKCREYAVQMFYEG